MKQSKNQTYLLRLNDDLKVGIVKAEAAIINVNDSDGSPNFDAVKLFLPNFREKDVVPLVESLELGCFKSSRGGFHISGGNGQGAKKTVFAETLCKFLSEKGYDVTMYYALD